MVPGHEEAGYRTPWGRGASADSLAGMVRVQKTPGLLPTHWWLKPGPGVSARLLACRAVSWGLAAGPRNSRAGVISLVQGS